MKNKDFMVLLVIIAGIIGIRFLLGLSFSVWAMDLLGFPFIQIGAGLRALSLQGGKWNILAIVIYLLLSVLPLALLLWRLMKKNWQPEDSLLVLLSVGLFYTLYMMINPGLLPAMGNHSGAGPLTSKYLLCVIMHSIVLAYLVITAIRQFSQSQTVKLYQYMEILLAVCILLFAFSIVGAGYDEMMQRAVRVAERNQGTNGSLKLTYLFIGLKYLVDCVPKAVGIWIAFTGMQFLAEMKIDQYSVAAVGAADRLTWSCKIGLMAMVCINMIFNGMQFLFVKQLRDITSYVEVPLFWIIFALGAMILSRMSSTGKALKEDNDSII
ncbi:hypothetical protein EII17_12390 [Clostridiales bacterium COT073_COT-073]|nr:hypothetical protein EII17_12390 [Clostridiales bacterium COT073_COT-073]